MPEIAHQIVIDDRIDADLGARLSELSVVQNVRDAATFRIKFLIDICQNADDMQLVDRAELLPGSDHRIAVLATVDQTTTCLVHGVITKRKLNLVHGGAGSMLELEGEDLRVRMAREPRPSVHSGRASEVARGILERYDFRVELDDTDIEYDESRSTLSQTGTDLEFIDMLAGRNGFQFWIESTYSEQGFVDTAYFRFSPVQPDGTLLVPPQLRLADEPRIRLRINSSDDCVNMGRFDLEADAEVPTRTGDVSRVSAEDGSVQTTSAESDGAPLGTEPARGGERRARALPTAGDIDEAHVRARAALRDVQWAVTARAETTVHALGHVVRPHQIVHVEGTGRVHDGRYFVIGVTHTLDGTGHKMQLELGRNALGVEA